MRRIKNGFTLIEVVVSMALLVLVFTGLIGVMILSQETKINSKNNLIASSLAQEGIDLIRFVRDQHYDNDDSDVFANIYDISGAPYSFTIMSDASGAITITPFTSGIVRDSEALKISNHRYIYTSVDPLAVTTPFRRLITTTYYPAASPPYLAVRSEVNWRSDNKQNTITVNDELTDWRP
jgi:prepilin-type N-terminal cleavage/methylation domain-containing protein